MLSLLTYGATFGVAEAANTRHELEALSHRNAIDYSPKHIAEHLTEYPTESQTRPQTEQEQRATRGGVIGWLKRLIQQQT